MTELWTRTYFDRFYLRRWILGVPNKEELAHVDFLLSQVSAKPGDAFLDVGCGQGRYSLGLAMRRLRVTGLDASAPLLREACRLAKHVGADVAWVLGDMRTMPFTSSQHIAILFDAFGFFDTPEENEAVIHELSRAVLPGGWLVLAVVNGPRILKTFQGYDRQEMGGRTIIIDRELDTSQRVVRELVTIEEPGVTEAAERRQWLYSRAELAALVVRGGFRVRSVFGDLHGAQFDETGSARIVMVCTHDSDHAEQAV